MGKEQNQNLYQVPGYFFVTGAKLVCGISEDERELALVQEIVDEKPSLQTKGGLVQFILGLEIAIYTQEKRQS